MALSDPDLVLSARRNAPNAWNMLLQRHQLPLYTYVAELLQDRTAALDVVQETFAAAVRHIATLRDDRRFSSWLFGIAHQKCVQHWRRHRRDQGLFEPPGADLLEETEAPTEDPREVLVRREQAEECLRLVEMLPPPQRATFLLHVLEEFSLDEIAEVTGVPVGTVKSRLHHARRSLRKIMEAAR